MGLWSYFYRLSCHELEIHDKIVSTKSKECGVYRNYKNQRNLKIIPKPQDQQAICRRDCSCETLKIQLCREPRTPIFEHYEVISRSVGDTTDIVTGRYDLSKGDDRHMLCAPEGLVLSFD